MGAATRPTRVLIAGGGVGAVEALLALRRLAGDRVSTTMLAPDPKCRYRPLSVTEPFGLAAPRDLDLLEIARENGGRFLRDAVAAVDVGGHRVVTAGGRTVDYDMLILAIGARCVDALPGATPFGDSPDAGAVGEIVSGLERGEITRLAFAVPRGISWPLGIYELALLCADHARTRQIEGVELTVATPESRPMEILGERPSRALGQALEQAGVEVILGVEPTAFRDGELAFTSGPALACDRAVALPALEAPAVPGIPQERDGFIAVDRHCAVFGAERVYAVGDTTWFPVKQGGLATQMADAAASSIASLAGAPVAPQPFRPVLRAAILTGLGPIYMRKSLCDPGRGEAAHSALWWPPAKVAGKFLAPYLATRAGYRVGQRELEDLAVPPCDHPVEDRADHKDIAEAALSSADSSARAHDFAGAMRWLEVAEDVDLFLPPDYETKRAAWLELATAR